MCLAQPNRERLPPPLPQSPSGAMSPLLFPSAELEISLCFTTRQGRGSRQPKNSSSSRSSKAGSTPREVWLWSLQCLKLLLCATPCASQPPRGHGTSLVRPHRAGLGVQERFPTNPSALSNLPGSRDLRSRQDAIPGSPGGFVNLTTPGWF